MIFRIFQPLLAVLLAALPSAAGAKTFLLDAELLEMRGGWQRHEEKEPAGAKGFLVASADPSKAPAAGAVEIPHAGKWRVWVRTKDFAQDRPGTRLFTIRLGGAVLGKKFGGHGLAGDQGWAWEDGGVSELTAGPLLVGLGEARIAARCESILFTDNLGYTPEGVSWKLAKEKAKVVPLELGAGAGTLSVPPVLGPVAEAAVAVLENEQLRVSFHQAQEGGVLGLRVATRGGIDPKSWTPLGDDASAASWTVIARPLESEARMSRDAIYPKWDASQTPLVEVTAGGVTLKTRAGYASSAPWRSGQCFPMRPVAAKRLNATTIELEFAPSPWGRLRSMWSLEPGQSEVKIHTTFQPSRPGQFSLGFHGPLAVAPAAADSWLLPFQFAGDRFPAEPVLILNATTPTPLVLLNRDSVSCALVAEPELIPFEWQRMDRSKFGFGLRNEAGNAQPMIYSPVMGLAGSRSEGTAVETKYRLKIRRGDWYTSFREVADGDFGLKDYRQPTTSSLTDTAFNLIDLIRDEAASGWVAKAKGSVQIESRNVVSQCSPLTYMSLYLLTGDEDLYQRFARPSLEFLISRPSPHFAIEKEIGDRYYQHQPLRGPVKIYGASTYASALAMTHGRSAVFGAQSLQPDGAARRTPGGHVQLWDDLLALYRVTGEKRWLDQAVAEGDRYLARAAERKKTYDPGDHAFVNNGYVLNWEGLLHLAEASGQGRFKTAAAEAARGLLTTLWTQPQVPNNEVTLNEGGVYKSARGIWWWGDRKKRLGIYEGPAQDGPIPTEPPAIAERRVPAWTVSNIGLGLEHPFTYVRPGPLANITMSTWAPNLLRVSQISGDPSFRTAARNATIGRYANYPGYYLDGQTDEFRRADYPKVGPDITSLYLHHIPAFTASIVDFLFTDVEIRSAGKVAFPWVRQCGYVWFDSRLWGHAPGLVYGEEAWPWLNRAVVKLDNPAIDHLPAQGGGKFHVVLLNQSPEPQTVQVTLDGRSLGREIEGATLKVHLDNVPAGMATVKNGRVAVTLKPMGIATLTLEGVKIDVPSQRVKPPQHFKLPGTSSQSLAKIEGTPWQAKGTILQAPPFSWSDLYVAVDAGLQDLKWAALRYRVDGGEEKRLQVDRFPFEFTVRLDQPEKPVSWEIEAGLADGSVKKTGSVTEAGAQEPR